MAPRTACHVHLMDSKSSTGPPALVTGVNSHGAEVEGTLLRLNRHQAVFEVYTPSVILLMSEVLTDFKIVLNERSVYSGRAVISSVVNAGSLLVCETTLEEHWLDLEPLLDGAGKHLSGEFSRFIDMWQQTYRVLPEFKVVVADLASLFSDLKLWMEQLELAIRAAPNGTELERGAAAELAGPVLSAIDSIGDRFEDIASRLPGELRPGHIRFARRHLHPHLLCSPFAYRTFRKPLGYPGDYEMVNMIIRDPYEGGSLFAKVVNAWFLNQLPARAHRNRIKFLKQRLAEETLRTSRLEGRAARIFNLGCGPASEVLEFFSDNDLSNHAEFTLLDFSEETISAVGETLRRAAQKNCRKGSIQIVKKSVQQVLKEAIKPQSESIGRYDFVYCAGLFDYLPDRVCKQLMGVFYQWLAPQGLLVVTNVDGTLPFRNKLEFILDWNLLYRTARDVLALKPEQVATDLCSVRSDLTAVNLFLEIRKPRDA
jgi:extracellular factor (EF) 3-hydroxypalmitic acid methyl ester biosynthesis protein